MFGGLHLEERHRGTVYPVPSFRSSVRSSPDQAFVASYASPGTQVLRTKYFSGRSIQYELPLHFCLSLRAVSGLKILIAR